MTMRGENARRGMLLPTALLLVLALSAAATSILVLARTELLLERGDLRYLRDRLREEVRNADPDESRTIDIPGSGGFVLVRAPGARPAPISVRWRFDPDTVVATLPTALEVGRDPPAQGILPPESACTTGIEAPLVRVRETPAGLLPSPDVPLPPTLGILGIEHVLSLSGVELGAVATFPGWGPDASVGESEDAFPVVYQVPPAGWVTGGEGRGILVSSGDVTLRGDAGFRGIVIVAGDLWLEGAAWVEGVVLVRGVAHLQDESRIFGCPRRAAEALAHPELMGLHAVPAGAHLGRY